MATPMNEKAKAALANFRALPKVEQCKLTLDKREFAMMLKQEKLTDFVTAAPEKMAKLDAKIDKYQSLIIKAEADKEKIFTRAEALKEQLDKAIASLDKAKIAYGKALNPPPPKKTQKQLDQEAADERGISLESYKLWQKDQLKNQKELEIAQQTVGVKNGTASKAAPPALTAPTTNEKAAHNAATEKALAKLGGLIDQISKAA